MESSKLGEPPFSSSLRSLLLVAGKDTKPGPWGKLMLKDCAIDPTGRSRAGHFNLEHQAAASTQPEGSPASGGTAQPLSGWLGVSSQPVHFQACEADSNQSSSACAWSKELAQASSWRGLVTGMNPEVPCKFCMRSGTFVGWRNQHQGHPALVEDSVLDTHNENSTVNGWEAGEWV